MTKFFFRFFLVILCAVFFMIIFLSIFGVETDKFDGIIKTKANEINEHVKLGFQKTNIHLNIKELNLAIKLRNPKILIKKNEIILSKLDLFLPLRSFFTSDFLLKRAEVSFFKNDIKDLTKITNIFLPRIINTQVKKVFSEGTLEGEFIIPFETDGTIGKNYGFSGKILDASINLKKDFSIKNLTVEINNVNQDSENGLNATIQKGIIYDIDISKSILNLRRKKEAFRIETLLNTNGKFNFSQIKKISKLFNFKVEDIDDINGNVKLKNKINFDLSKQFKLKNLSYETTGDLSFLEINTKENKIINKFLPEYNPKIVIKDTKINAKNYKSMHVAELDGFLKLKNDFDSFKIKEKYNAEPKTFEINGIIDLTNSKVQFSQLNYNKDLGKKSKIDFDIKFATSRFFNVKKLNFSADKNKIYLSKLKFNKNFEVEDFESLMIKTFEKETKNNDFSIKKEKKIVISGELFDAQPLLKSLYKKSDKKTFSKNFKSKIKVNFNKMLTGTNDDVSNFAMIASINKGSFGNLNLKGNFSENEILEMSISQHDSDKKILQVFSDRARPFVKNFDFIKGFEDGKLEYESIISQNNSSSNLLITDFKVSRVPALAKLLTLASLQGIADILSGEGIRFDSFEMKTNSEGNLLNIEDALAMGPAVSILLDGYVDKGKVVSLRGTLVPATKLNSIIASIPIVGDILVGKKTGEGVVGVSFKMKGPPKDIKTTVNPIKTLTPRFIVRAVEKMKKKKKEETK